MADAETLEAVADDEEAVAAQSQADADKLTKFLRYFDTAATPQQEQRAQCLQARRFAFIAGAQWEGNGWSDFSENMIRVEVNKVRRGLRKILNDYRANRVTVDFRPVSDADDETAETLDGLFRADAYRSRAGQAFDNAFDEGTSGGMGAWRLCNEYEDERDPDNDNQVINFKLIADADQSVYFDPNSKEYDKSDASWGCVVTAVARQAFVDEWGDDRTTDWPKTGIKPFYDWFTPDVIRVCEWYQVEEKKERRWTLTNAVTGDEMKVWASDVTIEWLAEQTDGGWTKTGRDVPRKRIHKYILSGAEILKDCGLIAGSEIPIIVFYGERRFIDNMERFEGHTQGSMDSNRVYNTIVSSLTESVGATPREVPVWYPQQINGHENDWARANVDRLAYLTINPMFSDDGTLIPQNGPVYKTTPPELPQQMAALLQIAGNDIAELTNAEDGADEVKANVSHEAMDLAATRTDEKSSGYMDNFRLSMEWSGRVYLGMAKEIYVEEGRKVQTLSNDGEEGEATLVQPTVNEQGQYLTINDFSRGKFNVIADVTESSATKRDKTVRKALGVAQIAGEASPDLASAALITAVLNMDGDGMDDFKKFARKAALQIGLVQPTDEEKTELAQAAQSQQEQPDPAKVVLLAQAQKFQADAAKSNAQAQTEQAKGVQALADAHLKNEQAGALGGPDAVPTTPTGLTPVDPAKQVDQIASAKLKSAQADKISHDIGLAHGEHQLQRIRMGHEISMDHAGHDLALRQQDHAESQPANDKAAA